MLLLFINSPPASSYPMSIGTECILLFISLNCASTQKNLSNLSQIVLTQKTEIQITGQYQRT